MTSEDDRERGVADEASKPAAAVAAIIQSVFPRIVEAVAEHRDDLRVIYGAVEREAKADGIVGVVRLSEQIAGELDRHGPKIFGFEIHLFPPSISFGGDDQKVDVSPAVGGGTTPDGKASIGVQVDVNASGGGPGYVGRGTVAVDVDATGKPTGASIEWKCVF